MTTGRTTETGAPAPARPTRAVPQVLVFGAVMVGALVLMSASLGLSLSRADALLGELRRSEDQLAQVTRIEADFHRLRADGSPEAVRAIEAELAAYRQSIAAEGAALGSRAAVHQASEARKAEALGRLFAARRGDLLRSAAGTTADDRRFTALIGEIVASERAEAHAALAAMQDLRRGMGLLALAVPLAALAAGGLGGWILLTSFGGLEAQVAVRTREIEASRQTLSRLDRTRRLFYSRLSHELRTPVTVMRGEAETALRDRRASAARLREALEHIAANGGFLQRRLEDMLALSRAEDGRILLEKTPVDLAEVMRRTATLAEPYVRSSGAELVAEIGAPSGPVLLGDASWLQQGLLAIVDNAAKFSAGQGQVRLAFSTEAGRASIAVSDSGPGVAAADLPHLFESYYQTETGRLRGGAGLGLSVARWVVEEHGGSIAAESPPGQGLTVRIELPVAS